MKKGSHHRAGHQRSFLLLRVLGKLLVIGCLIGIPVALYLLGCGLQNFEYQAPLSVLVFAGVVGRCKRRGVSDLTMLSRQQLSVY